MAGRGDDAVLQGLLGGKATAPLPVSAFGPSSAAPLPAASPKPPGPPPAAPVGMRPAPLAPAAPGALVARPAPVAPMAPAAPAELLPSPAAGVGGSDDKALSSLLASPATPAPAKAAPAAPAAPVGTAPAIVAAPAVAAMSQGNKDSIPLRSVYDPTGDDELLGLLLSRQTPPTWSSYPGPAQRVGQRLESWPHSAVGVSHGQAPARVTEVWGAVLAGKPHRRHDGDARTAGRPRGASAGAPRGASRPLRVSDIIEERAKHDFKEDNVELRRREEEMRQKMLQLQVKLRREQGKQRSGSYGQLDVPRHEEVEQLQRALSAAGVARARQAATSPGTRRGGKERGRRQHSQSKAGGGGRLRERMFMAPEARVPLPAPAPASPTNVHRVINSAEVAVAVALQQQQASSIPLVQVFHRPQVRTVLAQHPSSPAPPTGGFAQQIQAELAPAQSFLPQPPAPRPAPPSAPLIAPPIAPPAAPPSNERTQQIADLRRKKKDLLDELTELHESSLVQRTGGKREAGQVKEREERIRREERYYESALNRHREKVKKADSKRLVAKHEVETHLADVEKKLYHADLILGSQMDLQPLRRHLQETREFNAQATSTIKDLTMGAFATTAGLRVVTERHLQELEELKRKKEADRDLQQQLKAAVDSERDDYVLNSAALQQEIRTLIEENERLSIRREEKKKTVETLEEQMKGTLDNLNEEDRKVIVFSMQFMREREAAMAAADAERRGAAPPDLDRRLGSKTTYGMPVTYTAQTPVANMTLAVDNLRAQKEDLATEVRAVQAIKGREQEIGKDLKSLHNLDVTDLEQRIHVSVADTDRFRRKAQDLQARAQELQKALAKRKQAEPLAMLSGAVERGPDVVSDAGFSDLSELEGEGNGLDVYLTVGRLEERVLLEMPQQPGQDITSEAALTTMVVAEFWMCEALFTENATGMRPRYDSLVSFGPFAVNDTVLDYFSRGVMRFELKCWTAINQTAYTIGRASFPLAALLDCTPNDPNPIVAGTLSFSSTEDDMFPVASLQYKMRWRRPVIQALEAYTRSRGGIVAAPQPASLALGGLMDASKTLLVNIGGVVGLVSNRLGGPPEYIRPYVSYQLPGHREHHTKTMAGATCRFEDSSKMIVRVDKAFCQWVETGGGLHFMVFDAGSDSSTACTEDQLGLLGEVSIQLQPLLASTTTQVIGTFLLQRTSPSAGAEAAPYVGELDVTIRWLDEASAILAPAIAGPTVLEADRQGASILTERQCQIVWQRISRRLEILQLTATDWFYRYDTDKDSRWSKAEARAALSCMPVGLSMHEMDYLIDRLDVRKSGLVCLDDVHGALKEGGKAAPLEQWVHDVYRRIADALASQNLRPRDAFDAAAPGRRAQKREFFALVTSLDLGLRPEQLEWLWKLSDINSDGLLDFAEFDARLSAAATGTTAFTLPRPSDFERGVFHPYAMARPAPAIAPGGGMPDAWLDLCLARILACCREKGWPTVDKMVEQLKLREDRTVTRAELLNFCEKARAQFSDWEIDHLFFRLDHEARGFIEPRVIQTALLINDVSDSPAQSAWRRATECVSEIRRGLMHRGSFVAAAAAGVGGTQDFAAQLRDIFHEVVAQKDPLLVHRSDLVAAAGRLTDKGVPRLEELWFYVPKNRDASLDIDGFAKRLLATPLPGESGIDAMTDDHYALLCGRLQRALQRKGTGNAEDTFRRFAKPAPTGDGFWLSPADLEEGLRQTVGDSMAAHERSLLVNKIDTNKDGQISLAELQAALSHAHVAALRSWASDVCKRVSASLRRQGQTPDELFNALSKGTNKCQWPDFREMFSKIQPSLSEEHLQRLWQNFDKNADGGVSREEFKYALLTAEDVHNATLGGGDIQEVAGRVAACLRRQGLSSDSLFDKLAKGQDALQWADFRTFFLQMQPDLVENQLQRLFHTFDNDSSGGVSRDEMRHALAMMEAAEIASLPSGPEGAAAVRVATLLHERGQTPEKLFELLSQGRPEVRWEDFRALFAKLDPLLMEEHLEKLWRNFDRNSDGGVSLAEFKRALFAAEASRVCAVAPTDVLISRVGRTLGASRLSVADALSYYDATAEGSLTLSQWLTACRSLKIPLAPAEAVALHKALQRGPSERMAFRFLDTEVARVTARILPEEQWALNIVTGRARMAYDRSEPSIHDAIAAAAHQADAVDESHVFAALSRHAQLPDDQRARMRVLLERRPEDGLVLWRQFLQWSCATETPPPLAPLAPVQPQWQPQLQPQPTVSVVAHPGPATPLAAAPLPGLPPATPIAAQAAPETPASAKAEPAASPVFAPAAAMLPAEKDLADGILDAVAAVVQLKGFNVREQLERFDSAGTGQLDEVAFIAAMRNFHSSTADTALKVVWRYLCGGPAINTLPIDVVAKRLQVTEPASPGAQEIEPDANPFWSAFRLVRSTLHVHRKRIGAAFEQMAQTSQQPQRLFEADLREGLASLMCHLPDREFQALYGAIAPQPNLGATAQEFSAALAAVGTGFDEYARQLLADVGRALVNKHGGKLVDAFHQLDFGGEGEVGKGALCALLVEIGDINLADEQLNRIWEIVCAAGGHRATAMHFEAFRQLMCGTLGQPVESAPLNRRLRGLEESCEHLDRLNCLEALRGACDKLSTDGVLHLGDLKKALNSAAPWLTGSEVAQICRLAPRLGGPLQGEDRYTYQELLARFESGKRDWYPLDARERSEAADICRYIDRQVHVNGSSSLTQRLTTAWPQNGHDSCIRPMHLLLEILKEYLTRDSEYKVAEMSLLRLGRPIDDGPGGLCIDLTEFCERFEQLAQGVQPPVGTDRGNVPLTTIQTAPASWDPPRAYRVASWPDIQSLHGGMGDELRRSLKEHHSDGRVTFHKLIQELNDRKEILSIRQQQQLKSWLMPVDRDYYWPQLFAFGVVIDKFEVEASKAYRSYYQYLQVQVEFCSETVTFQHADWVPMWDAGVTKVKSRWPLEPKKLTLKPDWHALFILDGPGGLDADDIYQVMKTNPASQEHKVRIILYGLPKGASRHRVELGFVELGGADLSRGDITARGKGSSRQLQWNHIPINAQGSSSSPGADTDPPPPKGDVPIVNIMLSTRNAGRLYETAEQHDPRQASLKAPLPVYYGPSAGVGAAATGAATAGVAAADAAAANAAAPTVVEQPGAGSSGGNAIQRPSPGPSTGGGAAPTVTIAVEGGSTAAGGGAAGAAGAAAPPVIDVSAAALLAAPEASASCGGAVAEPPSNRSPAADSSAPQDTGAGVGAFLSAR